jgi:hypothetical protein
MDRTSKILFSCLVLLLAFFITSAAYAQQPLLQITSPGNGALLTEGQTYTITLSADPSVQNIGILAESAVPDAQPTSDPTQFSLTLPTTIPPGIYHLTAAGSNSNGDVESDPVTIDIERADYPVQVSAEPLLLSFKSVGDQLPIIVYGTYADATRLLITNSSSVKTHYTSNNTQVATVGYNTNAGMFGAGVVTAVGPGQTSISRARS